MLIVENLTVTLKCRIVIKALQSSGHFTFNLECVMLIVEGLTVTEKCRLVIKVLLLDPNLYVSKMLSSEVSHLHLHPYHF